MNKYEKLVLEPPISQSMFNMRNSMGIVQENDNTPLEHTPGNPPSQLWKESLYSLLVKV